MKTYHLFIAVFISIVFTSIGYAQQDCASGTTVCNDQSFSGNSSGFGTQELNGTNSGCLGVEHQSSWYFFEASSGGNLEFTISPTSGGDDYDFAVWGPYPTGSTPASICPPSSAPLRCSYAAGGGNTGLLNGSGDNTEGSGGNRFVEDIVASTGDVFILVVDNFSTSTQPFDLNWSLSNGASLDCTPLPVDLADFRGQSTSNGNVLTWVTYMEINNNYFVVQRSEDGINFYDVGSLSGAGNSSNIINYSFTDYDIGDNYYYRIKQVDYDGKYELSNAIYLSGGAYDVISIFPNPSYGDLSLKLLNENYKGDVTINYSNVVGKTITETVSLSGGNGDYSLSKFNTLESGIYFINVMDENGNTIKKEKIIKK